MIWPRGPLQWPKKDEGKVSVKALLLSAVKSFRAPRWTESLLDVDVLDTSQKKASSAQGLETRIAR